MFFLFMFPNPTYIVYMIQFLLTYEINTQTFCKELSEHSYNFCHVCKSYLLPKTSSEIYSAKNLKDF